MLISTKFSTPRTPPGVMVRERLVSRFEPNTMPHRVTAVIAPAGYGKSTLLSQWREKITRERIPSGWVNLDDADNDPARFLAYVATSLADICPEIEGAVLPQLLTGAVSSLQLIVESLVIELSRVEEPFVLFLDDYHRITERQVFEMTDWLVNNLPESGRIVLASRSQPPIGLYRLKLGGQLDQLGPDDLGLRFDEADEFINDIKALGLARDAVERLCERTEGWFAGLQLVAMSIKNVANEETFIAQLSGTDQDITSYLSEVVLSQQPGEMRDFLLRTSMLDRFNAELCREITGIADTQVLLERAYAANLFLVPLDRNAEWYRYHHLFEEFLRNRFTQLYPDEVNGIYSTASRWFAEHDLVLEAIRYAMAAGDYGRAAELIAAVAPDLVKYRGEHATLLNWTNALPDEVLERWPENVLCWAWSLVLTRDFDQANEKLRWLDGFCERRQSTAEPETLAERDYVLLKTQLTRSVKLSMVDDSDGARRAAADWVARWPDADEYDKGVANNVLGIACIGKLDFEAGLEALYRASAAFAGCGAIYGVGWSDGLIGIIKSAQGRLTDAIDLVRSARDKVGDALGAGSYSVSFLSIILADLFYEQGDLEAAEEALGRGFPSALDHGTLETCFAAYSTMAKIRFVRGDLDGAIGVLDDGQRRGGERFSGRLPLALRGEALLLYLRAGHIDAASRLAQESGFLGVPANVPGVDRREISKEIPKLAVCRIQIASGQFEPALSRLTALITRTKKTGRLRKAAELLVLKARAAWLRGEEVPALRALADAVDIGESAGLYRTFMDDEARIIGPLVARMIEVRSQGESKQAASMSLEYLQHLAHGLGVELALPPEDHAEGIDKTTSLTARELDILGHLGSGLSNRDLSKQLFISEHTVKWHLNNLYRKLGVRNRTGAIAAARRLNVIS